MIAGLAIKSSTNRAYEGACTAKQRVLLQLLQLNFGKCPSAQVPCGLTGSFYYCNTTAITTANGVKPHRTMIVDPVGTSKYLCENAKKSTKTCRFWSIWSE